MQKICQVFSNILTVLDDGDFFVFVLLSRESDGGAMHRTNYAMPTTTMITRLIVQLPSKPGCCFLG